METGKVNVKRCVIVLFFLSATTCSCFFLFLVFCTMRKRGILAPSEFFPGVYAAQCSRNIGGWGCSNYAVPDRKMCAKCANKSRSSNNKKKNKDTTNPKCTRHGNRGQVRALVAAALCDYALGYASPCECCLAWTSPFRFP
jgi:hypothetical protein